MAARLSGRSSTTSRRSTMNSMQLAVTRERDEALITRDRMRIDVDAEFYVRVQSDA